MQGYHVYKDIWTAVVGKSSSVSIQSSHVLMVVIISYVKFSYGTHFYEIYEILHPMKISCYTVNLQFIIYIVYIIYITQAAFTCTIQHSSTYT